MKKLFLLAAALIMAASFNACTEKPEIDDGIENNGGDNGDNSQNDDENNDNNDNNDQDGDENNGDDGNNDQNGDENNGDDDNNDQNGDEGGEGDNTVTEKALVKRIKHTICEDGDVDSETFVFQYDSQNRITKAYWWEPLEYFYDGSNMTIVVDEDDSFTCRLNSYGLIEHLNYIGDYYTDNDTMTDALNESDFSYADGRLIGGTRSRDGKKIAITDVVWENGVLKSIISQTLDGYEKYSLEFEYDQSAPASASINIDPIDMHFDLLNFDDLIGPFGFFGTQGRLYPTKIYWADYVGYEGEWSEDYDEEGVYEAFYEFNDDGTLSKVEFRTDEVYSYIYEFFY